MRQAAQVTILFLAGAAAGLCLAAGFPAGELSAVYVRSYDGAFMPAFLQKPAGDGPFPAILLIHGGTGGWETDHLKEFASRRVPKHLFELGYVVLTTDYRRYHFGEDEIQDVLAAYQKLASYPFVDKNRIGVIGGSHGGYLTKMLATRISPAAVVSFAGLSDIEGMFFDRAQDFHKSLKGWEDWREQLLAGRRARQIQFTGGRFEGNIRVRPGSAPYEVALDLAWRFGDRRELYRAISPKDNAEKISCPILYLVGGRDRLRFAGKKLIDVLKKRGVTAEYSEHADMPHGFYFTRAKKPPQQFHDALKVTTAFLERHVKKAAK
jgi:dipeptidyl aminopeptidase/acylaminoacyl peptidase